MKIGEPAKENATKSRKIEHQQHKEKRLSENCHCRGSKWSGLAERESVETETIIEE